MPDRPDLKMFTKRWLRIVPGPFLLILVLSVLTGACATSDKARLKATREAYLRDDFPAAEASLHSHEVLENEQNRLLHYYLLSSIAMSQGQYEKALYFLERSRTTAVSLRSASGLFELFSTDYKSNPVEFSALHSMMVMAYSMLASEGKTLAWSTPDIKDKKGNVLIQAMSVPARTYSPREIADFRQKARSELLAWDTFLESLKRSSGGRSFYQEDLWARILASFVHGISDQNNEKRTAELLASQAGGILNRTVDDLPSRRQQAGQIEQLLKRLQKRATARGDTGSMVVLEAGVMPKYKVRRYHLGLSTLFQHIKDPYLRSQMEQIGLQVILSEAPEFGLVLFTGAIAGAVSGDEGSGENDEYDGPPRFFSDAVDRSFGFEIRFPSLAAPPADTRVQLVLSQNGKVLPPMPMPILSPLQEILSTELERRLESERFERSVRIGLQYLAILIPAIKTYQQADKEGNAFKKLLVLAGYFIAKKVIDNANQPDLRSWNLLPKFIAAQVPDVPPGTYDAKVLIDNRFGHDEAFLGSIELGRASLPLIRKRVGDVGILNHKGSLDPKSLP